MIKKLPKPDRAQQDEMDRTFKTATAKTKNDAFAAIHSAAKGLHSTGAINKTTLREYDALCLNAVPEFNDQGHQAHS